MPFIIDGRRGGRLVAAVAAALALTATPALAGTTTTPTVSTAAGCTQPTTQAFLFANDKKDYVLAPGGNVEGSLAGWSLTGGAAAVTGSAPAVTAASAGTKSLLIPSGGSVTSAPMCVAAHSPFFRFQARNTGTPGALKVEVLYLAGPKFTGEREAGTVTAGATLGADEPDLALAGDHGRQRLEHEPGDRRLPVHAGRHRRPLAGRRPLRRPVPQVLGRPAALPRITAGPSGPAVARPGPAGPAATLSPVARLPRRPL